MEFLDGEILPVFVFVVKSIQHHNYVEILSIADATFYF
jgi:hypothetical protein